jgi:general stress protein 26
MKYATDTQEDKKDSISKELENAGVTHSRIHPFTNNYLPKVINDDEHIHAAVFGRRKESEGFFGFVEGVLVATNQRVIFLDHRPGYTTMDEITYDVISGVNISATIFSSSVTLFTKVLDYKISFVNHAAATQFAKYIEGRITKHEDRTLPQKKPDYEATLTPQVVQFLDNHEVGVVSTVERTGAVAGAAVYYVLQNGYAYFVTKELSAKAHNIVSNQHVALTVYDASNLQTLQMQGIVEQVRSDEDKVSVLMRLNHERIYTDGSHKPPLLRTTPGKLQLYRIVPTKLTFTDYMRDN